MTKIHNMIGILYINVFRVNRERKLQFLLSWPKSQSIFLQYYHYYYIQRYRYYRYNIILYYILLISFIIHCRRFMFIALRHECHQSFWSQHNVYFNTNIKIAIRLLSRFKFFIQLTHTLVFCDQTRDTK